MRGYAQEYVDILLFTQLHNYERELEKFQPPTPIKGAILRANFRVLFVPTVRKSTIS